MHIKLSFDILIYCHHQDGHINSYLQKLRGIQLCAAFPDRSDEIFTSN